MCGAILEAMALRVPVIARNIPGNAALIAHHVCGVLFDSAEEFVQYAAALCAAPEQAMQLADRALSRVQRHHSAESEQAGYRRIVTAALVDSEQAA
jgi:glycosyltransferase involved in cell wall biosynthesis